MKLSRSMLWTLLLVMLTSIGVQAASPYVVTTVPVKGDGYVHPNLAEIRVTFSEPMNTSTYSFVTLGSGFPEVNGNPQWLDDTTCVLPVLLEEGKEYALAINAQGNQGFRSVQGEPATSYLLAFSTSTDNTTSLTEEQIELNRKAYNELQEIFTTYYSYKDRLGIDWEGLFQAKEGDLLQAPSTFIFAVRVGDLLKHAQDPHVFLQVGQQSLPTFLRMPQANYNHQALFELLTNVKRWSNSVISGEAGEVGYIVIGGWVPDAAEATKAITEFRDKAIIIIDVRPNSGGNELIAQEVAGLFTDQPVEYAQSRYYEEETEDFTRLSIRELSPNGNYPRYQGKVVVLSGEQVMSSNEAFLLMMKQVGATIVGAPSYGSSGNPKPYTLANGITIYVPQWIAMDMDGNQIEGNGIKPDILLEFSPQDFANDDPVFRKALNMVQP